MGSQHSRDYHIHDDRGNVIDNEKRLLKKIDVAETRLSVEVRFIKSIVQKAIAFDTHYYSSKYHIREKFKTVPLFNEAIKELEKEGFEVELSHRNVLAATYESETYIDVLWRRISIK